MGRPKKKPGDSIKENIGVKISPNMKRAIEDESKTLGITVGTYARQLLVLGWKSRNQKTTKGDEELTRSEISLSAFDLDKDDQDLSRYVEKIIPFIRSVPKPLRVKLLDIIDISFNRKESHEYRPHLAIPTYREEDTEVKQEIPEDQKEILRKEWRRNLGKTPEEIEAEAERDNEQPSEDLTDSNDKNSSNRRIANGKR